MDNITENTTISINTYSKNIATNAHGKNIATNTYSKAESDIFTAVLIVISFMMVLAVYKIVVTKKKPHVRHYNNNSIHPLREIYRNRESEEL